MELSSVYYCPSQKTIIFQSVYYMIQIIIILLTLMVILSDIHSVAATVPVIVLVLFYLTLTTQFVVRMLQFYRMLIHMDEEL